MKEKMNCKECVRTCCDMMEIRRKNKKKGLDPNKIKIGDWLEVAGIIWKKCKNGFWRCIAFDVKTRLCKIWKYRPEVCRSWNCSFCKKTYRKTVLNRAELIDIHHRGSYTLNFSASSESLMEIEKEKKIKANEVEIESISLV